MLIDSHCHLHFPELINDLQNTLARCACSGIKKLVVNATHPDDWQQVISLAAQYPDMLIPAIGLHPWRVHECPDGWQKRLKSIVKNHPSISIGEIGLDRWIPQPNMNNQRSCFLFQLSLATTFNLPVSIHCLKAWGTLLECLEQVELPKRGIHIHAFGGSREVFERLKKYSPYYSFSGYFLHPKKKATAELFLEVPMNRLLIETDAPSMLPPPQFQTKAHQSTNFPDNLVAINQGLANLIGISPERLAEQTSLNAEDYFCNR